MTHKTRDCVERPRKKGAKWTGENIKADEIIQQVDLDWDEKRDRWNGYDPKEHDKVIEEYNQVEEARKKAKASELDKQGPATTSEAKKIAGLSDDEDEQDDDKYADAADMPGQHVNQKTRTTIRNLRIREDTAKYLLNLDTDSAFYDPKTRSMRENPLEGQQHDDGIDFSGDNFVRYTGDAPQMAKVQMFAWQASDRGNEVHLQANPTQVAILHKEYESKKDQVRDTTQKSILEKYGGEEYLEAPPKELLLAQSENYVEYSRTGRVIKGQERAKARSKYEEDGKSPASLAVLVVLTCLVQCLSTIIQQCGDRTGLRVNGDTNAVVPMSRTHIVQAKQALKHKRHLNSSNKTHVLFCHILVNSQPPFLFAAVVALLDD